MKIERTIRGRPSVRGITLRRLAAARRALRQERQRLALFADQVEGEQETPEDRITRFDIELIEQDQGHRDLAAKHWLYGRAMLHTLPAVFRAELVERWNRSWLPKRAEYFADYIRTELRRRGLPE